MLPTKATGTTLGAGLRLTATPTASRAGNSSGEAAARLAARICLPSKRRP